MARDAARTTEPVPAAERISSRQIILVSAASAILYFFSNPKPSVLYDYTFRVADKFLRGGVGFAEKPPHWLNEFVPFDGLWYSVFPLGAVVTMLPFAALKTAGVITDMPSAFIAALCAGISSFFMLLIARSYDVSRARAILVTLGILFGSWTWTNITFGGAWQLALGFALVGELGAIYFTLVDRRPFVAGAFFALAFGNRTEILLTAPIFLYWMWKAEPAGSAAGEAASVNSTRPRSKRFKFLPPANAGGSAFAFCVVPFVLGIATLVYNYVRFNSITDFGHARIPGVLNEPWYNQGIFSPYYIPRQIWEMLFRLWEFRPSYSLPMPNPFSGSILISSPFLLFAFRTGSREKLVKYLSWGAVLVICLVLWMHGNAGGWQFAYRYAIAILPFLFLIMLENAPKKISPLEWAAYIFSFVANAYATWLFHWTDRLKP